MTSVRVKGKHAFLLYHFWWSTTLKAGYFWKNCNSFSVVIEAVSSLKQPGMFSAFASIFFLAAVLHRTLCRQTSEDLFFSQNTPELDAWEEKVLKVDFNGSVPWRRWRFDPERFEWVSEQTELSFVFCKQRSPKNVHKFSSQTTCLSETISCYSFKKIPSLLLPNCSEMLYFK